MSSRGGGGGGGNCYKCNKVRAIICLDYTNLKCFSTICSRVIMHENVRMEMVAVVVVVDTVVAEVSST